MTQAATKPSNFNVPNVLTVIRIILVPVMVVLLFTADPAAEGLRWWATGVFAIAMATDFVDGNIARRYNLVTDFGKLWDPIADKALTGAAFISLSILQGPEGSELPWYFTIIILVREWGITLLRDRLKRQGIIMAANKGGKAKTVTQTAALLLFLLYLPSLPGALQVVAWVLMWGALILTVVTGVDYLREARRATKRNSEPRRAADD